MERIERSIEVNVPVRTAYNQWTQFEEFPRFMPGLQQVWQLDDKRLRWRAQMGGVEKEWEAEITEQLPDRHIAWRSIGGAPNSGMVMFTPLDEVQTQVTVRLEYDPQGLLENLGSTLGVVSSYVDGALARFKTLVEGRGQETGAWRGEIHRGAVQPGGSDHLQDMTTAESIEQAVGGETTNAGITGDQPLPPTGASLPHSYGTSGDLREDTPGATTGRPGQDDATSRMAQMSGGRLGHGPADDQDTTDRMAQMTGGIVGGEAGEERGAADAERQEPRGRALPNNEGLVDSDIPSDRDRR